MKPRFISGRLLRLLAVVMVTGAIRVPIVAQMSTDQFEGMTARSVGPMGTSGRISAIDAVVSDPNIVYAGAAAGGLWKSLNGGQTWRPLFEDRPFSAIGAVAVDQADPDVVWVGIGEGNPPRDPAAAAVFRSIDGGESWTAAGLPGLQSVTRILLHPTNPGIVFAGVSGSIWAAGIDRGVYRTMDGGLTWTPVLFVDETTGVSDLVMDPTDPSRLLAAMSSSRRSSWSVESRGPGSGVYLTRDGGNSWIRLEEGDGIPGGELGRISLDIFRGDPRVVHALVDSGEGMLLRSYNRGRTWETVQRGPDLLSALDEPSAIVADPLNESRIYHLASHLTVSDDGGATFEGEPPGVGPGYRVLWVHPEDPRLMYAGTDRGAYVSRDGGEHWDPMGDLPLGSFNRVAVDMEIPFNVFGGLERGGSWRGLAYGWSGGGSQNREWIELGSSDDFGILVDPGEGSRGYTVSRDGGLVRFDLETGQRKNIRPWAPAATHLRLNRDVPIAFDPHDPAAIFYGSQFVHKSVNRGETWQILSGDLTANDPAGRRVPGGATPAGIAGRSTERVGGQEEDGATITVISPSSLDPDLIWVGTDEGDVQLTRSAGGEWTSVRARIGGVPDSSWVAHIEPSAIRPGAAIVAFDAHRTGNTEPLIFSTDNYGRDWRRIASESDMEGFVHTVKQDLIAENLLFAGTEAGLYVSLNRGEDWFRWTRGLPRVPVHDLVLHPRDHDLVIATHGRGAYVLDDIRPLRELATDLRIADLDILVFELPPASVRNKAPSGGTSGLESNPWRGDRPDGVLVSYWLGEPAVVPQRSASVAYRAGADGPVRVGPDGAVRVGSDGAVRVGSDGAVRAAPEDRNAADGADGLGGSQPDPVGNDGADGPGDDTAAGDLGGGPTGVSVEILDFDGEVIRTLQGRRRPGVNRVAWDFMEDPPVLNGPLADFAEAAISNDDGEFDSAEVLPGLYSVRISIGGVEGFQWLEVLEDSRLDLREEDRIAKYQAVKLGVNLDLKSRALQAAVASVHADLQRVIDWVRDGRGGSVELLETSQALGEELTGLADFSGVVRYRSGVRGLTSSHDQPTEGQRLDLIRMEEELDTLTRRIGDFLILDVDSFGRRVNDAGLDVAFFIGPIG